MSVSQCIYRYETAHTVAEINVIIFSTNCAQESSVYLTAIRIHTYIYIHITTKKRLHTLIVSQYAKNITSEC